MRDPEEKNKEYEPDLYLEDMDEGFDEEFLQDNWDEIMDDLCQKYDVRRLND